MSANLDSENQYEFVFTVEYAEEKDLLEIMGQVKLLLRLYGSTILAVDTKLFFI